MESNYPITRTKIIIPRRHDEILTRQRLFELVNNLLDLKLIIIAAPAGYGKTSLLIDFANHSEWPISWLSLDTLDQDPFRFVAHFISAIQARFPEFGQNSIAVLNNTPQEKLDIPALVTTLVNDIYEHITEHFILVLDDYHLIEESDSITQFINHFLQDVDENCHLFISSRRLLTLSDMPLLVARNQVGGISFEEISFSAEEIQALLLKNYHLTISDESAVGITEQTEGWITGLLLSTHLLDDEIGERIRVARVSGVGLYEYLAQQVFDNQPQTIKDFMLRTSILEEFDVGRCQRVIGEALQIDCPWRDLMDKLIVRNLFVFSVGEGTDFWLRYHHLFRDFLQTRMRHERPEETRKLTIALADDFAVQRDWEHSFVLYSQVNAVEKMVSLIEQAGPEMVTSGQLLTLKAWMNDLPPEIVHARPSLISLQAAILIGLGDVKEGIDLLDEVIDKLLETNSDKETLTLSLIRRAIAYRIFGEYEKSKVDSQSAIELLKDTPELGLIRAEAMRILGGTYYLQGELKVALTTLKESLRLFESYNDQQNIPKLLFNIGMMNFQLGNYVKAEMMYQDALEYWQSGGNLAWASELLNNLGVLLQLRGDYEAAAKNFEKAIEYARISNSPQAEGLSLSSLGDLYRDLDAFREAVDVYKQAQSIAKQLDDRFLLFYLDLAEGALERISGDLPKAKFLLQTAESKASNSESAYMINLFKSEWAMYHLTENSYRDALNSAKDVFDYFQSGGHENESFRAAFCCALALTGMGQKDQAKVYLNKVMGTLMENDYATPLIVQGREFKQILSSVKAQHDLKGKFDRILERIDNFEEKLPEMRRNIRRQANIVPFAPPRMIIKSFGKAQVHLSKKLVTNSDWKTQISRDMFFLFLAHPEGLTKEQVGLFFWPDATTDELKLRFKNTLYRLRRAVGRQAILLVEDYYKFNWSLDYEYDVETFNTSIEKAESAQETRQKITYYKKAVDCYKGEYLSEIGQIWAMIDRQTYYRMYLDAVMHLATMYMTSKAYKKALRYSYQALSEDACLEDAHRLAMRIHAATGNRAAIVRQYERCRAALTKEINAPPSTRTRELYETLIQN
ncbi:MAG: tetratricopeptide repeat protein [Chloroflexota bacterium]|nr:tetratricopeptide repeat protein [Chloroflexota bacterium]